MMLRLLLPLALSIAAAGSAFAQDISNPLRLMFVADAEENIIDVVDLYDEEVVYRIETEFPVDDVIATPYAPVLVYTNIERRLVT
ncbi:MAG TPA: hypothetical protein VIV14_03265, partial [Gammaproteobacteria bacterium]